MSVGFYGGINGSITLSGVFGETLGDDQFVGGPVGGAVLTIVLGVSLGMAQWLILRRYLSKAGWWVLATIIGFTVGIAAMVPTVRLWPWVGPSGVGRESTALEAIGFISNLVVFGVVIGVSLGIAQWLVLRRYLSQAGWWVLASTIGLAISIAAFAAMWVVGDTRLVSSSAEMVLGLLLMATIVAAPAVSTGTTLVWLLREPGYPKKRGVNWLSIGLITLAVPVLAAMVYSATGEPPGYEELRPGTARWHFSQAEELAREGRYEEAIAEYDKAIELDQGIAEMARVNRRYACDTLEWLERTIESTSKEIELDPNAWYYYDRAIAYGELGKKAEAIADLKKLITLTEDPVLTEVAKWRIEELSNTDTAVPSHPLPDTAAYHFKRGDSSYRVARYEEALAEFTNAIELDQGIAGRAYLCRCGVYHVLGQYEQAIKDYSEAILINPGYANAYLYRGMVYATLGQTERAIEDFSKGIEIYPHNAEFYLNRASAYKALGENTEAIADLEKFITLADIPARIEWARQLIEELSQ